MSVLAWKFLDSVIYRDVELSDDNSVVLSVDMWGTDVSSWSALGKHYALLKTAKFIGLIIILFIAGF